MKKLFSILMILALFCPLCVMADDDPVIGIWYIDMDFSQAPAFDGAEDYATAVALIFVNDNGDLKYFELDFHTDGSHDVIGPDTFGKWEKTGYNTYRFSILGVGEYPAYLKGDDLHTVFAIPDCYYIFHKMEPLNWYKDMYYNR